MTSTANRSTTKPRNYAKRQTAVRRSIERIELLREAGQMLARIAKKIDNASGSPTFTAAEHEAIVALMERVHPDASLDKALAFRSAQGR